MLCLALLHDLQEPKQLGFSEHATLGSVLPANLSTYCRVYFHWDLSHILLFFSSPLCMAVPQWQPATWEVWAHCDLYSSCLLEGAVVQLHICIFIEPYSLLHSLLTAADGATIFHTVWERRRGTGLNITWRRQQLWSNQENRTDRELETE